MRSTLPPLADWREGAAVSLRAGTHLPGDGKYKRRTLYVRTCFGPLFDLLARRSAAVLIGTPGIGKSWFVLYMMWRLQQLTQPAVIVWERSQAPHQRMLLKEGKAYVGALLDFREELKCETTWYIVDGCQPSDMSVAARTILISSPRRDAYKEFMKNVAPRVFIMPLWTHEEIHCLHKELYATDLDWEYVRSLVDKYGAVPRNVLEQPFLKGASDKEGGLERDLGELESALQTVDLEQVLRSTAMLDQIPEGAHRLLHMEASPDFTLRRVVMASPYVGACMVHMLATRDQRQMRAIMSTLASGNSAWSSVRGLVFEQFCHALLSAGGTFSVRLVYGGEPQKQQGGAYSFSLQRDSAGGADMWTLTLPPAQLRRFDGAEGSSSGGGGSGDGGSGSGDGSASSGSSSSGEGSGGGDGSSGEGSGEGSGTDSVKRRRLRQAKASPLRGVGSGSSGSSRRGKEDSIVDSDSSSGGGSGGGASTTVSSTATTTTSSSGAGSGRTPGAAAVAAVLKELNWSQSTALTYMVPLSPTFPAVDAIMPPCLMFQMTVSAERPLPSNALPELLDVLPDADSYFLIFCVDKPSFKVTGLKTAPTSGRMGRLRVMQLCVDLQGGALRQLPPPAPPPPSTHRTSLVKAVPSRMRAATLQEASRPTSFAAAHAAVRFHAPCPVTLLRPTSRRHGIRRGAVRGGLQWL